MSTPRRWCSGAAIRFPIRHDPLGGNQVPYSVLGVLLAPDRELLLRCVPDGALPGHRRSLRHRRFRSARGAVQLIPHNAPARASSLRHAQADDLGLTSRRKQRGPAGPWADVETKAARTRGRITRCRRRVLSELGELWGSRPRDLAVECVYRAHRLVLSCCSEQPWARLLSIPWHPRLQPRSGEPIASQQAQRACPRAHVVKVVKVARLVGGAVRAAGRLGVG
jgi:hypothetical protein